MDEQLNKVSTSPYSIISEFSSHDSMTTAGSASASSTLSVIPPLRSSVTLADMSNISNILDYQNLFLDGFDPEQSSGMSRWQSDAGFLNLEYNLSSANYAENDPLSNRNVASSSISDLLNSPMSRMSTSSSSLSFHSVTNQKPTGPRLSRFMMTDATDQLTKTNKNSDYFSSALSPLPLPTLPANRQTFSGIDYNGLQQVPRSVMITRPQTVQNTSRSNSMPSWRGSLPMKFDPMIMNQYQITPRFSQKVFLGGIPSELTEAELLFVLRKFGKCNIKWPKNDALNHAMPGFCHVVFRESRSVCELLKHCIRQQRSTIDYFLHIHMSPSTPSPATPSIRTDRLKPIQVVPWNMEDNVFVMNQENITSGGTPYKDWSRTIFVSPLHGKMTAFSLGTIMANVFGAVSMAQINTDKYGYPTGTGTVLFCDSHSYMRAVAAGAIDIKCDCFHKLLDIDPFLRENEPCAFCSSNADLFCRNFHCLRSYCRQCWLNRHGPKPLADHQPATRRQQPLPQI